MSIKVYLMGQNRQVTRDTKCHIILSLQRQFDQ